MKTSAIIALLTLSLAAAAAAAHPGHKHTILGTISMVREGHVEVVDTNNEKTTFSVTKDTKILVGKAAGSTKDLKAGVRAAIEAEEGEGEKFVALTIQLPARAAQ